MITRILIGNSLEVLPALEKNSVHCSVTSPPYYGLRKYDGDQQCNWPEVEYSPMPGLPPIRVEAMTCALGHEPTIEAYVGHLVAIYREVWRVLRDDGVAWIVMGDSYSSQGGPEPMQTKWQIKGTSDGQNEGRSRKATNGLKQGDLMLVPHRFALALQADGWTVRNDVVWAKKAPMPESVRGWMWQRHKVKVSKGDAYKEWRGEKQGRRPHGDNLVGITEWQPCPGCPKCEANGGYVLRKGSWRHTRAHEFVLMCTKQMGYWSDQEAVKEESTGQTGAAANFRRRTKDHLIPNQVAVQHRLDREDTFDGGSRNPRSVLSPSSEPFPGKHFAVFPSGLITNLIKATCPARCCPECKQGWSPVVEQEKTGEVLADGSLKISKKSRRANAPGSVVTNPDSMFRTGTWHSNNILGYRPTCDCGRDDHMPGVCLDPFFGAGTTGLVCDRLGLDCIGIDISEKYVVDLAAPRIRGDAPLLAEVMVEGI